MRPDPTCDVLVIGGGPVGLTAAIAAKMHGFAVAVAETAPDASAAAAQGRSAALLSETVAFLKSLNVWEACLGNAAPLKALEFIDATGRLLKSTGCAFVASEIGEEQFGFNIANADLITALKDRLQHLSITPIATGRLVRLESGETAVAAFESGCSIRARLIVAADGKASRTRELAGIRVLSWAYDQVAVATSFSHERDHCGLCIEMHRQGGPFTLVPLPGRRSSLVWVERKREADRIVGLNALELEREIESVSHFALGSVSDVAPLAAFPLSSLIARNFAQGRVALAGEAAHVTPPIGAQGLNLGVRAVDTLVTQLSGARAQNFDIGGDTVLAAYSRARRADVLGRTLGVDLLNRSLLSGSFPLQFGRAGGLFALKVLPAMRRFVMRRGIAPVSPSQKA